MVVSRVNALDIEPQTYFDWSQAEIAECPPDLKVIFCSATEIDIFKKIRLLDIDHRVFDIEPATEGKYFILSERSGQIVTDYMTQADFESIYMADTQSADTVGRMIAKLISPDTAKIPFMKVSELKNKNCVQFRENNGRVVRVYEGGYVLKMPHGGFCASPDKLLPTFLKRKQSL